MPSSGVGGVPGLPDARDGRGRRRARRRSGVAAGVDVAPAPDEEADDQQRRDERRRRRRPARSCAACARRQRRPALPVCVGVAVAAADGSVKRRATAPGADRLTAPGASGGPGGGLEFGRRHVFQVVDVGPGVGGIVGDEHGLGTAVARPRRRPVDLPRPANSRQLGNRSAGRAASARRKTPSRRASSGR